MTTEHYEVEDFDKVLSFESGQFAIVDAEVIKAIKDKIPLADKAIFVATKQSRDNNTPFMIKARYNDASLEKLVITPAPANAEITSDTVESVDESFEGRNLETRKVGGAPKQGKGGDAAEKIIRDLNRIGAGSRPKSSKRSERNKRYSAKGDPKTKLTKGKSSVEQRIDQAVSHQGARLKNFGQPKVATECLDLLQHIKTNTITEDYLDSLTNGPEIRRLLADIRDNGRVNGKSFDLVYEAVQILDKHWNKNARRWVEDIETLIEKGSLDV